MTDTALSESAMRQSLLDIRLPVEAPYAAFADFLLAAGLGGAAALILIGVVHLFTGRIKQSRQITLKERISALQTLPDDARRVGFLHLLREIAPERHAELRQDLYRRNGAYDAEAEVLSRA